VIAAFFPIATLNGMFIIGILRAGGDAIYSLVIDVGTVWLVGVPLVAFTGLGLHWGMAMVFVAAKMENIAKLLLSVTRYRSGKWIQDLTGSADTSAA
jgi:Na+-driven multidrug efflux pump